KPVDLVQRVLSGGQGIGGAMRDRKLERGRHRLPCDATKDVFFGERLVGFLRCKCTGIQFTDSAQSLSGSGLKAAGAEKIATVHGRGQESGVRSLPGMVGKR